MKRVYFAISFLDRDKFYKEINFLVEKARNNGFEIFVFVDKYLFKSNQEKEMMQTAFKTIDSSDFLIADLTHKSIGVGIEIGYAYAKKKPILYLRQKGSEYSTTAAGCSDFIIEYENKMDFTQQVLGILKKTK
jgi:nucleoside 2-deoxyribosyltransferase